MTKKKQKVLIYQMGKVASSSIKLTLSSFNELDVIHTHHLSYSNTRALNSRKTDLGWHKLSNNPQEIKELFNAICKEKQVKIITLVREPISRNISAFFQTIEHITGVKNIYSQASVNELVHVFLKQYPHEVPLYWFENEFYKSLDVNIYNYSFPKNTGAQIIKKGKFEILVMHHNLVDATKKEYLEKLLNIKNIIIKNKNISTEKPYNDVYKSFINNIKIPKNYLLKMLNSKYVQHFYTKQEIDLIYNKWE